LPPSNWESGSSTREGNEGKRARKGARVEASRHFFFPLFHCTQFSIAGLQKSSPEEPNTHQNSPLVELTELSQAP